MKQELAYFLTWTTYGSWLHGDERGSVGRDNASRHMEVHPRNERWADFSRKLLKSEAVVLDDTQRQIVEDVIRRHSEFRRWKLHIVACRTNHVHVVVTALNESPERVMEQFKSWTTRVLRERGCGFERTWTRFGSTRYLNDEASLAAAIGYVRSQ